MGIFFEESTNLTSLVAKDLTECDLSGSFEVLATTDPGVDSSSQINQTPIPDLKS